VGVRAPAGKRHAGRCHVVRRLPGLGHPRLQGGAPARPGGRRRAAR
jgi:hypothetical protein